MSKVVVMLGTHWDSPGGMTAVIHNYRDAGLWQQWPIRYLATYHRDSIINKLWMALRAYCLLFFWLCLGQVALVHAHSAVYASFWRKSGLLLMARLFGVKTVFHLHGGEFEHFYHERCGDWGRAAVRYVLRSVDELIVLTPQWVKTLQGVEPACSPIVIGNPIALPEKAAAPVDGKILFLGRLRDVKGVFELIQALPAVAARFPSVHLVLGGDGDPEPILTMAQALGVLPRVELAGWVEGEHKQQLLREAQVFVLPSYYEAQPVCILEAMAQGVPVVATAVGGVPDMCIAEQEAILVPAKNVAALEQALMRVLSDAQLRATLIANARARVERDFVYPVIMQRIGECYRRLGASPLTGVQA